MLLNFLEEFFLGEFDVAHPGHNNEEQQGREAQNRDNCNIESSIIGNNGVDGAPVSSFSIILKGSNK